MSNPHDTDPARFVHAAVQRLNRGVSEKFIPQPTRRQVLGDVLLGLGRFKTAVRWRYFWTERKSRSVSSTPSFSEEPGDDDSSASIDDVSLPSSESAKTRFSRKSEGFFLKFRIFYHKSEELSLQ
jgi:hypothetical protein